jgi:hypothetical protein
MSTTIGTQVDYTEVQREVPRSASEVSIEKQAHLDSRKTQRVEQVDADSTGG